MMYASRFAFYLKMARGITLPSAVQEKREVLAREYKVSFPAPLDARAPGHPATAYPRIRTRESLDELLTLM